MRTNKGEPLNGSTMNKIWAIYKGYAEAYKIPYIKPHYRKTDKLPFIPNEKELDIFIASLGNKLQPIMQLLKETGMRIGEAMMLKWIDIDEENRTVNVTPEKHSNGRILPISRKLIAMLHRFPDKYEHILPRSLSSTRTNFCEQRKRIAKDENNPRILKIGFHTLRHFKGTMEYHNTLDVKHVQYVLGHKNSNNTDIYINLEKQIFNNSGTNGFIHKVAHNLDEYLQLLDSGFQYVSDYGNDGTMKICRIRA